MLDGDGPAHTRIRILLVDDNPGFRQRMARLLQLQTDFTVIGEASDGTEAIVRVRDLQPDVVLIDFRMSGLDGFTAARTITAEFPRVKVFMLTAFPGALDPDKVAKNGIAGLLIKDQPAAEILAAIRKSVRP